MPKDSGLMASARIMLSIKFAEETNNTATLVKTDGKKPNKNQVSTKYKTTLVNTVCDTFVYTDLCLLGMISIYSRCWPDTIILITIPASRHRFLTMPATNFTHYSLLQNHLISFILTSRNRNLLLTV